MCILVLLLKSVYHQSDQTRQMVRQMWPDLLPPSAPWTTWKMTGVDSLTSLRYIFIITEKARVKGDRPHEKKVFLHFSRSCLHFFWGGLRELSCIHEKNYHRLKYGIRRCWRYERQRPKLDEIESSHTKWSVKGSCPGKREVERGDIFLFYFILLWIKKVRDEEKTYIWGSVRWKTQKLKLRNLQVSVPRTDVPVYIRERGGGRRRRQVLRTVISVVIHT